MTQILELNQKDINHVTGGVLGSSIAGTFGTLVGFVATTTWTFQKTESIKIFLWTMHPSLKHRIIGSTIAGLIVTQYTHKLAKRAFMWKSSFSEILADLKYIAFGIDPNK